MSGVSPSLYHQGLRRRHYCLRPRWRLAPSADRAAAQPGTRRGFTLVEMMVAVGLTVLMMTMVVTVFGLVMDSIRGSRASIEVNDRLRAAKNRLQADLAGVTVTVEPPRNPAMDEGYLELIEGPVGPVIAPGDVAKTGELDSLGNLAPDSTVGDTDDILMFTVRSRGEPFVGRWPYLVAGPALAYELVQSQVAEVAWYLRGTTLYRRVQLVYTHPTRQLPTVGEAQDKFLYQNCDISLHLQGSAIDPNTRLVPNTLGDLTKREHRQAHRPNAWPHDPRFWSELRLPTLEEYSEGLLNKDTEVVGENLIPSPIIAGQVLFIPNMYGTTEPFSLVPPSSLYPNHISPRMAFNLRSAQEPFDAWRRPHPYVEQDPVIGQIGQGTRIGEEVILTDVIGFDVKVWDPGAPIVEVTTTSGVVTVMPSDPPTDGGGNFSPPAIVEALAAIGTNARLVGFGAYVDLNYLCRMGGTLAAPGDPGVPANYHNNLVAYCNTLTPIPPSTPTVWPYVPAVPQPQFHHAGDLRSGLWGTYPIADLSTGAMSDAERQSLLRASVYDTYTTHYESDGVNQSQVPWNTTPIANVDAGSNGIDDNLNGAVDESTAWPIVSGGENETAPPYPHPLRGIQIKIRVFEPDTRQVREVTLEHEFLPQ